MKLLYCTILCILCISACTTGGHKTIDLQETQERQDYTQFVDPFIGTDKMGHVFPGVTAPFGMVQLSPQTNFEVMFNEDGSYNSKTYDSKIVLLMHSLLLTR